MATTKAAEHYHAGSLTDGWHWFGRPPDGKKRDGRLDIPVWAPHAKSVSVVGDFNNWDHQANRLTRQGRGMGGLYPGPEGVRRL